MKMFLLSLLRQLLALLYSVAALPAAALRYFREWHQFRRLAVRFPGPWPLPIVGNVFHFGFFLTGPQMAMRLIEKCATLATFILWIGPYQLFVIGHYRDVQAVLTNSKNRDKPFIYKFFAETFQGLGVLGGETWKRHFRIISPFFRTDNFPHYVSIMDSRSNDFIEKLRAKANNRSFNATSIVKKFAMDITFDGIAGVGTNIRSSTKLEFTDAVDVVIECMIDRLNRPWLYFDTIFNFSTLGKRTAEARNTINRVLYKLIEDCRHQIENTDIKEETPEKRSHLAGIQGTGMLEHILTEQKFGAPISDEEIAEELGIFLFAGHSTSHPLLESALYVLGKYPEVQEKLVCELKKTFGSCGSPEVTLESLNEMTYLDMFIKETLRLYPPVWLIARLSTVEIPLASDDLVLPAGATVIIPIKAIHMDPEVYPDPEVFDPERFSHENTKNRPPGSFVPFGAGQRICIGRKFGDVESKIFLTKLLWNYEVLPDPTYKPTYTWSLTVYPTNGTWIRLKCRNHANC